MPVRRPHQSAAVLVALLLAALTGCAAGDRDDPAESAPASSDASAPADGADAALLSAASELTVTVHKTETCVCCGEYEAYLAGVGFDVEVVVHDDIAAVKEDLGVPADQYSCHTNVIDGYVAEGHVPAAALLEVVEQAPAVAGIALAGMPAGSPGMPGEQEAPFEVTTFSDGEVDGMLGRY